MGGTFSLQIEHGPNQGRVHPLTAPSSVLGRHASSAIVLADPRTSRQHARFDLRDGQVWLTDLGSANGTELNGQPLQGTQRVRLNDLITVGDTQLRLIATGEPAAVAAVANEPSMPSAALNLPTVLDRTPSGARQPVAAETTLNGRYRLERELGEGGFARVFLATDLLLNRTVAAKVLNAELSDDPAFLGRFSAEAKAVARLDHPNILGIYDYGEIEGTAYLIMPYVDGGTLHQLLRRQGPPSLAETNDYLRQITAALDHAHRQRLVHRDIKPQNMLLRSDDGRLLLSDFGIAKLLTDTGAPSKTGILGTVAYMAPEQFQGQVSQATDIYALGCLTFQLLTGRLPYEGTTERVMYGHLRAPVPALRDGAGGPLPATLQPVIERALAKLPEDRFPSAGAFAVAFAAAVAAGTAPSQVSPAADVAPVVDAPPSPVDPLPIVSASPVADELSGALTPPRYAAAPLLGHTGDLSEAHPITPSGGQTPRPQWGDPPAEATPASPELQNTPAALSPRPGGTRQIALGLLGLLILALVVGGAYYLFLR